MSKRVDSLIHFIKDCDLSNEELKQLKDMIHDAINHSITDTVPNDSDMDIAGVIVNYDNVFDRNIGAGTIEHLMCTFDQIPKLSKESFYQILDSYSKVDFMHEGRPKLYICPYCGEAIDLDTSAGIFKCECGKFTIYIDKNLVDDISLRDAYSELHSELINMKCLPQNLPFVYAGDMYTSYTHARKIYRLWRSQIDQSSLTRGGL